MTTFTPEMEKRRELVNIALKAAQELRAALNELDFTWRWLDLPRAQDILEHKAKFLGLDPDNLGIDSKVPKLSDLKGIAPGLTGGLSSEEYIRQDRDGVTLINRVRTHDNQEGED